MTAQNVAPRTGPFRDVPYMGVIFVVAEASRRGFVNGDPEWCNLGQGQPEVGAIPGAPPRIATVDLEPGDHAYGPLEGVPALREAVAAHYNRLYRQGRTPYGPEHVAVAQGGRLVLSRILAGLGSVNVGYQLPDYTAYEDMLGLHLARITPHPIRARERDGFLLDPGRVAAVIDDVGLRAFLVSNPCNPTGRHLAGEQLDELVRLGRRTGCAMVLDEFYSHYIYRPGTGSAWEPARGPVSAAAHVQDPDTDPVLLVDGLTKNYRYPGWRVGWVLGPPAMVETVARVASSLDGGPSRIAQRAALRALEPAVADAETEATRAAFAAKRNLMVERLTEMGVTFAGDPDSTFYVWGRVADLPPPLNDPMTFFWQALERKVMTVPGVFFDVNPGKRRHGRSQYADWMRFSFGPPMDNVRLGLGRLAEMVAAAR